MTRRRKRDLPTAPVEAQVERLAHDGRGVAQLNGKTVFIDGALPGERVAFLYRRRRARFDEGTVAEVLVASPDRVAPRCPHFGICGGCSLQHLDPEAQRRHKQRTLVDNLRHFGGLEPLELLPPLVGPEWGYRRKARLGAKYVLKKDRLLLGFRERGSSFVADLHVCEVLDPKVSDLLVPLRALIAGLEGFQHIPQVEVAVADNATALVFRHLAPLEVTDQAQLRAFAAGHGVRIYLQPGGLDSVHLLWPEHAEPLSYRLPDHGLELQFRPVDFTQVNAPINRAMVDLALELLDPQPQDRVLDLFCGLGNFTLPLARRARAVVGVEGDAALVEGARRNARHNALANASFEAADLAADLSAASWAVGGFDKVLLDPPRSGALAVVRQLAALGARRLVYVSCNPATLARDAGELVRRGGYRLSKAGIMDMFPHTTHVESIALFEAGI